jgi:hypothetical protein
VGFFDDQQGRLDPFGTRPFLTLSMMRSGFWRADAVKTRNAERPVTLCVETTDGPVRSYVSISGP